LRVSILNIGTSSPACNGIDSNPYPKHQCISHPLIPGGTNILSYFTTLEFAGIVNVVGSVVVTKLPNFHPTNSQDGLPSSPIPAFTYAYFTVIGKSDSLINTLQSVFVSVLFKVKED
jgi:hypothetical protein